MRRGGGWAAAFLVATLPLVVAPERTRAAASDSTGTPAPAAVPPSTNASPAPPRAAPPPPKPITSATVPPADPVYRDLERLDALGLLGDAVLGQRPLSRGEVARILRRASMNPLAARRPARELLIRLRKEFPWQEGVEPQGVDEVKFGAAWLDDDPAPYPLNNGVGRLEAVNAPLTAERDGRDYGARGTTFWLRTRHTIPTRENLVFAVAPEFLVRLENGEAAPADSAAERSDGLDIEGDIAFKSLYGRLQFGPVILQVGRDQLAWGPTGRGGLMMSTNARPMDMAFLTSESAFRLPWIFRSLGPSRWFVGMAYLGSSRVLPKSGLAMLRASFRPHRLAEVGFSESLVMLGKGAPTDEFWQYVWEFFPAGRVGTDTDLADHRFGFDAKLHAWPGRLTLLAEAMVDDARSGHYDDVTALRYGIYLPAVGPKGAWQVRGEYLRLPSISYRHGRWTTGYAIDGRLIGNDLGPDARGARLELDRTGRDGQRTIIELAWDARDRDQWDQEPVAGNPPRFGEIFRTVDRPTETRWRGRIGLDWPLTPNTTWQPSVAVERVHNAGYVTGVDRTDLLLELSFRYAFAR